MNAVRHELPIKRYGPRLFVVLKTTVVFGETIPCGFVSDGASVPRVFWWLISPHGAALYAAVKHDFRLREFNYTRKERALIDFDFYRDLRASEGVSNLRALAGYAGVRIGSWWFWLRAKKRVTGT